MGNTVNYAERLERQLVQKYTRELLTSGLTTNGVKFIDAKTIKLPFVTTGGYKNHGRQGGFNRQDVSNDSKIYTLAFDRDVEFFVDSMDVDESNQVLTAANITNTFLEEHAIPETDCYRISKILADFEAAGGVVDTEAITKDNILAKIDAMIQAMDEAEVPAEGRELYITPVVNTVLKEAQGISRSISVSGATGQAISRAITALEGMTIKQIPSNRMKSAYNFTNGCVPAVGAKQINMMLVQPKSVIACDKHSYIRLWPEGSHTQGDGWLYQNRKYGDLFVLKNRIQGIAINMEA